MEEKETLANVVVNHMFAKDEFSKWLGIEIGVIAAGTCTLSMTVRPEMLNGFGIAHGGITYALADSALAFAANGLGVESVSIETSISHTRPLKHGEVITAIAKELNVTKRFAIFEVMVTNNQGHTVAIFKGTVFRTGKAWDI